MEEEERVVRSQFLDRFPDDAGLRDYWVAALDSGQLSAPDFRRLTELTDEIGPAELAQRLAAKSCGTSSSDDGRTRGRP